MSKIGRSVLSFGLAFTLVGSAFARSPAALSHEQGKASAATAVEPSAGYRGVRTSSSAVGGSASGIGYRGVLERNTARMERVKLMRTASAGSAPAGR
jgi:hypothetical protein